ncbi:sigma54 specific transcriptional regulator, Fis family [Alteromonadaceae bacterium Bs31]|nr:sigma54 specific transcriptional regulator, Fis family [Alteromonadaceae bacterium Bs31]
MNLIASSINTQLSQMAQLLNGFEHPAILVSEDYEILAVNTLYQQAFGEIRLTEQAPQHCYQVSHGYSQPCDKSGEDCPMQRARISGKRTRILHIHQTKNGAEHIEIEMLPLPPSENGRGAFVELMKPIPLASGVRQSQTMVGSSPAFLHMLDSISKVSRSDASVLLLGETGTGKELAARAIHQSSQRSEKPLITLECSGLTDTLFESELFGHSKGAFTGASSAKKGLVELAHGGTLFLDEIADVPLSMQVKLLRLLENRTFRPIGSTEIQSSDFRLICATHKNIKQLIAEEKFRADLFHRINVFPIRLPSLQERLEDLPQIARALLQQVSTEREYFLTDSAIQQIAQQSLEGNIRELRNILNRAIVLADTNVLDRNVIAECLEIEQPPAEAPVTKAHYSGVDGWVDLKTLENNYLQNMHHAMQGNVSRMADVLGISVRSLYRKLKESRD